MFLRNFFGKRFSGKEFVTKNLIFFSVRKVGVFSGKGFVEKMSEIYIALCRYSEYGIMRYPCSLVMGSSNLTLVFRWEICDKNELWRCFSNCLW